MPLFSFNKIKNRVINGTIQSYIEKYKKDPKLLRALLREIVDGANDFIDEPAEREAIAIVIRDEIEEVTGNDIPFFDDDEEVKMIVDFIEKLNGILQRYEGRLRKEK